MFEFRISGIRCKLSLLFPAVLLYMLYQDRSGVVLFSFLASCIHETGHIVAAYLLNCPPCELNISCFGMRMIKGSSVRCSVLHDVIITMAGPLMNMMIGLVLTLTPVDPSYSHIHFMIGIFNSLPVIPLDGGRVVAALCEWYVGGVFPKRLEYILSIVTISLLCWLGLLLAIRPSHNISLLIVSIYLIFMRLFYNGNWKNHNTTI